MTKKAYCLVLVFLAFLMFGNSVKAADPILPSLSSGEAADHIVFAVGNFEPHHYQENGEIKGIFIEIVEKISERLGVVPEFKMYPWKRALNMVKKGEVDGILSVYYTKERSSFLRYTDEFLSDGQVCFFIRDKDKLNINKVSDMQDKRLLWVRGTAYGSEFESLISIFESVSDCNDMAELVKVFNLRPGYVAVANNDTFRFVSKKFGFNNRFKAVHTMENNPLYIAFSKAVGERGRLYAKKFDIILKELKKERVIFKISKKYIE